MKILSPQSKAPWHLSSLPAFNQVGLFFKEIMYCSEQICYKFKSQDASPGQSWSSHHLSYLIEPPYVACLTLVFILLFHHHSLYPQPSPLLNKRLLFFSFFTWFICLKQSLNPFTFLNNIVKVPKANKKISSKQSRSYNETVISPGINGPCLYVNWNGVRGLHLRLLLPSSNYILPFYLRC